MDSNLRFTLNQPKYGNVEYIVDIVNVRVEKENLLSEAFPEGIGNELKNDAVVRYGFAIAFANKLLQQGEFALSVLTSERDRVVYLGHVPVATETLQAVIVIDRTTVDFIAGGDKTFFSLTEGCPIAIAKVRGNFHKKDGKPFEIYFCRGIESFQK